MKISYNWLKDYIKTDLSVNEMCSILTDTGLEVDGVESFESVKGGLEGLVIGKVLTCAKHPDADKLSVTTVDVGGETVLPIVCGAPNVAAGQTVVVATVGTVLYSGDDKFTIKKSKMRGEPSHGMICAEDEIGLGASHAGIMVIEEEVAPGTPAREYFEIETDYTIEIGLTPNRVDAASHIGVARDLAAYLSQKENINITKPDVNGFATDNNNLNIEVEVKNSEACPRYAGVTISGVKVEESPKWLQTRLKAIGLAPINNVVDITNYVLHETGQPLHAFDSAHIIGNKVIVDTMADKTKFITLDEQERELSEKDLMICNTENGMCIAGVFGGIKSGVSESTTDIFLESAYFNPVWVRKTAKRHGLNTDASFRFERGVDPENTVYALKRAAMLIKEIAGGTISSEITDIYPTPFNWFKVDVSYTNIERLIGKNLGKDTIKSILNGLEINIVEENDDTLKLEVPPYRVDVQREADVIEEILRIYGYNNVEIPEMVQSTLQTSAKPNTEEIVNTLSDYLAANGFNEIMNNSLTKKSYYENLDCFNADRTVSILNPLSSDLNGMRQSLLFGGLESVIYNINRRNADIKMFEIGKHYFADNDKEGLDKYSEFMHLSMIITGQKEETNWITPADKSTFFTLKSYTDNVVERLGFNLNNIVVESFSNDIFSEAIRYTLNSKTIAELGIVSKKARKMFDIKADVFYADIHLETAIKAAKKNKVRFTEIPKFPEVRRDLALLLSKSVSFNDLKKSAFKTEKKLLKKVNLFDVYMGDKIAEDKKSYAISFSLLDESKTLTDKQIDKIMNKMIATFKRDFNAELR